MIKNVLIHSKKGKLEQAHNRKWKKYWTALKGIELLFYHCDEKTVTQQDLDEPSHRLDIDRCIVQAVPEHAKLENVFSLSSKHGNAYYLQVRHLVCFLCKKMSRGRLENSMMILTAQSVGRGTSSNVGRRL